MPAKQQSADQTEKPTPRRLREARRHGDVWRSRELTSTVTLVGWLALFALMGPSVYQKLEALFALILQSMDQPFAGVIGDISAAASEVFLTLVLPMLLAIVCLGLITEFLQVGPVIAPGKVKPDASRLNPADGVKRMFSQENLIEVVKSLVKTFALLAIFIAVLFSQLDELLKLPSAAPGAH